MKNLHERQPGDNQTDQLREGDFDSDSATEAGNDVDSLVAGKGDDEAGDADQTPGDDNKTLDSD